MAGFKGKSSSATSRPGTKSKHNKNSNNSNNKKNPPKKSTPTPTPNPPPDEKAPSLPRHHQQLTLNIFRDTFAAVLSSDAFTSKLQALKQALFERDFVRAFGGQDADGLAVYAARWSPTRALCYASILYQIHEQGHLRVLTLMTEEDASLGESETPTPAGENEPKPSSPKAKGKGKGNEKVLRLLSIGGGAAEIVAFGSFLGHIHRSPPPTQDSNPPAGSITLLDSAPWAPIIAQLHHSLITSPPISKYASSSLRESNKPMIPSSPSHRNLFHSHFLQHDVLELDKPRLSSIIHSDSDGNRSAPVLVTLLFTLNELFTAGGILKTTTFLLNLTAVLSVGSLLLVVDSPGSYSETVIGSKGTSTCTTATGTGTGTATTGTGKKYPMQWLLDKILREASNAQEPAGDDAKAEAKGWKKLESHDSVWFRLPGSGSDDDGNGKGKGKGLDYPIPLENMRYQMHLYRLVDFNSLQEEEEGE